MKTSTEIFAHNLKVQLEKKNKTQSDLARFLKVTPTAVSRWAKGSDNVLTIHYSHVTQG